MKINKKKNYKKIGVNVKCEVIQWIINNYHDIIFLIIKKVD